MEPADVQLRDSLLKTLAFLASDQQQTEFGSRGYTYVYQDEFACWWFDTYILDDERYLRIFSKPQLEALKRFSGEFEHILAAIGSKRIEMASLLVLPEWRKLIDAARRTEAEVRGAM